MKKRGVILKHFPILCMIIGLSCIGKVSAQEKQQIAINSTGGSYNIFNYIIEYSIGEMTLIDTYQLSDVVLTQGFLQPYNEPIVGFVLRPKITANNLISPNADGVNDYLVFTGIESYDFNVLTVYDRGGKIVYRTTNYKNDWNAYSDGKVLNEGTYYYILDLGDKGKIKSFVSIVFDTKYH